MHGKKEVFPYAKYMDSQFLRWLTNTMKLLKVDQNNFGIRENKYRNNNLNF